MEQLKSTSINLGENNNGIVYTNTDTRIDNLYNIVEELEYRIVELENTVKQLKGITSTIIY